MADPVIEITVKQLAEALQSAQPPFLIDVRHDWEYAAGALPEARHLPLAHLATLAPSLPKDRATPIVTYCHHGVRSAKAASLLMAMGYTQVASMAGGIDAWSTDIDARVERY